MGFIQYLQSPLGKIGIIEEKQKITQIFFMDFEPISESFVENNTDLLQSAKEQLEQYFSGQRKIFDLPLNPQGTNFMKADWKALTDIPYGETRSYKQIAEAIGNPKACRAVGMANNRNPIAIVIPCHRVIGADGSLVGYAGGLHLKKFLLDLEQKYLGY